MIKYQTIRIKLRKIYIKCSCKIRAKKIKNNDFTIISNNCWGSFIYQSYNLKYNSPTIGLFFMADDYIKFLKDIKEYINSPIEFINPKKSKWYEQLNKSYKFGEYPIGKIKDIEIYFLHYKNKEEALEKWNKRCSRINWEKLIVKFNDQNGCNFDHIESFNRLKYKNKICFLSEKNEYKNNENVIRIPCPNNRIITSYEPFGKSKYIDINKLINSL